MHCPSTHASILFVQVKKIVKILEEREDLRKAVRVFYQNQSTTQCIATVGERIILALNNAPQKTTYSGTTVS